MQYRSWAVEIGLKKIRTAFRLSGHGTDLCNFYLK